MGKKEDQSRSASPSGGRSDSTRSSKNIQWDETRVKRSYPNAFEVNFSRDEVALRWGSKQDADENPEAIRIRLLGQTIMSPYTAKRLADALTEVTRQYEDRYGLLEGKAGSEGPVNQKEDRIHEKEAHLFQAVKSLDVEMGFERSFKVSKNSLLGNRFLLGTSTKALGKRPHEKILDLCLKLGMPANLLTFFREKLPGANYVHFGFEETGAACLYKAYLEFREKIENEIKRRQQNSGQFLLHLGFKWNASDKGIHAIASYTWHRLLSVPDMFAKMSAILDPQTHGAALQSAKDIVSLAAARIPSQDMLYLEVTEESNARRSFDVNLYRAGLRMEELYPLLLKIWKHYSIAPAEYRSLYEQAKSKVFGHVSGGIDREGKDFLTVYFGVEGVRALESGSGFFADKTLRLEPTESAASAKRPPDFLEVEKTDEKARFVFQLVKDLHAPIAFERSFKVFDKTLLADRFLLGFYQDSIRLRAHERVMDICRKINMPSDFQEEFRKDLPAANIVLFGFERNEKGRTYKAYLEFADRIEAAVQKRPNDPQPFMIYRGFKWDLSNDSRKTETVYTCFPAVSGSQMLKRISHILGVSQHEGSFDIVGEILETAESRVAPAGLLYFEAEEEDNPRLSFDINFYKANLGMKEIYPALMQMVQNYAISREKFMSLYDAIKAGKLGHLAGGTDREGRSFLTVYFENQMTSNEQKSNGLPEGRSQ